MNNPYHNIGRPPDEILPDVECDGWGVFVKPDTRVYIQHIHPRQQGYFPAVWRSDYIPPLQENRACTVCDEVIPTTTLAKLVAFAKVQH